MKITSIIDISRKIYPGMTLWPQDKHLDIIKDYSLKSGDFTNLSHIMMSLHTGTHADMPLHFIDNADDAASVNPNHFLGVAKIFEINVNGCIKLQHIKKLSFNSDQAVFFKTLNSNIPSESPFVKEYVYIDMSAAEYLAEKKIKTVGIDYFSVDAFHNEDYPVHKLFLSNRIPIIEGLMLKDVKEGEYMYACLPLKIKGVEASPVRAVLFKTE